MRRGWSVLVLIGLAGCTSYQPVDWNGRGAWSQARQSAIGSDSRREPGMGEHKVAYGETLSELALRYRTPLSSLARLNRIEAPYRVYAGQILTLPEAAAPVVPASQGVLAAARPAPRPAVAVHELPPPKRRPEGVQVASLDPAQIDDEAPVAAAPLPREKLEASRGAAGREPPPLSGNGFLWPVRGKIASSFGSKPNGTRNDGINIRAAEGAPVMAAENGIVVFAGEEIPGYGRMLLISHADGFMTAYAHNREILVGVGEQVERGQRIARVGRTGNVSSPQLHFELRDGKEPIDPVTLLEAARTQVASAG